MRQQIILLPYLKTTEWGGEEISRFKSISINCKNIGESWELSAVPGCESIVMDGEECGMTLSDLVKKHRHELLGEAIYGRYGDTFPIIVKFIDKDNELSIQVLDYHESLGYTCKPDGKFLPLRREDKAVESIKVSHEVVDGCRSLLNREDSFMGIICIEGRGEVKVDGISTPVKQGETLLLPAKTEEFDIDGAMTLLTVVIPTLMTA